MTLVINKNYIGMIAAIALAVLPAVSAAPTSVFAAQCTNLQDNLYQGLSDASADGEVTPLQNYLFSLGYLKATPNGYFGPATFAAVEQFQAVNGISVVGEVGPLTRSAISQQTCSAGASTSASSVTSASTVVSTSADSNTDVTVPATGQVLSEGNSIVIKWNSSPSDAYNINLEQPGGSGAGFIALNQSPNTGTNQYSWNVGKVFSSQTNSSQYAPAGTYRIHLQSAAHGISPTDEVSGWFTIVGQQFNISSVVPSSAFADNATPIVLFGSGFTSSASVYFDTNFSNLKATNAYISPDGTLLVFMIPTTVSPGSHTLIVNDGRGSQPVSLPFVVSSN